MVLLMVLSPAITFGSGANTQARYPKSKFAAFFLQSQDVELPEDFLVRVDNNRLEVALESFGLVERDVPRSNLLVHLINSNGEDRVARSDSNGMVEFDNVDANEHYALVVAEAQAHAAIPVMAVSSEVAQTSGLNQTFVSLPLATPNREELLGAINRDIPPTQGAAGELYEIAGYRPETLSSYEVQLRDDGSMLGRVVVLDRELAQKLRYAKLTFLQNNQVVGRTDSNSIDGGFSLSGITAGNCTVIAAGPAGYASFAFKVLPPSNVESLPPGQRLELPIAVKRPTADRLCVCLIPPRMIPKTTEIIREAYSQSTDEVVEGGFAGPANSGPPGGFGGGIGGGLGGGGGGGLVGASGGLGGLGGIGALGAIAAVLASDNGDSTNNNGSNIVSRISD